MAADDDSLDDMNNRRIRSKPRHDFSRTDRPGYTRYYDDYDDVEMHHAGLDAYELVLADEVDMAFVEKAKSFNADGEHLKILSRVKYSSPLSADLEAYKGMTYVPAVSLGSAFFGGVPPGGGIHCTSRCTRDGTLPATDIVAPRKLSTWIF